MQGRSLEAQVEAAAGGRPEGPLGVVAEAVAVQAATGRCKREGARTSRHPPMGKEKIRVSRGECREPWGPSSQESPTLVPLVRGPA